MKPWIIISLLASTAIARAEFTNTPKPVPSGDGEFECSVVRENPQPRRDRYPTYEINVSIRLTNGDGPIEAFGVIHTTRSGRSYDRSAQYTDASINQTLSKMQWNWTGFRYPKIMNGSLW